MKTKYYNVLKKNKDLELLRKSIKHWCLDIRRPLLNGDKITRAFYWNSNYDDVKMFNNSCALCVEYRRMCNSCPLNIIGEKCCSENSAYLKFYCNLNIESADNMITVLVTAYWVAMSEKRD